MPPCCDRRLDCNAFIHNPLPIIIEFPDQKNTASPIREIQQVRSEKYSESISGDSTSYTTTHHICQPCHHSDRINFPSFITGIPLKKESPGQGASSAKKLSGGTRGPILKTIKEPKTESDEFVAPTSCHLSNTFAPRPPFCVCPTCRPFAARCPPFRALPCYTHRCPSFPWPPAHQTTCCPPFSCPALPPHQTHGPSDRQLMSAMPRPVVKSLYSAH